MAPGTNKAAGLHVLLNALGLSMAECCAIGDSENDLEMLQSVRVACAMGNAVKKTKAHSRWGGKASQKIKKMESDDQETNKNPKMTKWCC